MTGPPSHRSLTARLAGNLSGLSLARQFALAGGAVMCAAAIAIGTWMSDRIETGVVHNSALATALYMESILSPISQELGRADRLSPGALRALDEVFTNTPLGQRVVLYSIWKPDGRIVASSNPDLVGQVLPISENLRRAFTDEVRAEFAQLKDDTGLSAQARAEPLLEIYSPVHEAWSGRIVAVAEFYESAPELARALATARRNAWIAVAALMAGIGMALYWIVLRGSRTIDRQKAELTRQLDQLQALSSRNSDLRQRVQGAAARMTAMQDRALRRVGSDLHDGPAQMLALANLRLDPLLDHAQAPVRAAAQAIDTALADAMAEIRAISKGLILPEIADRPLSEIIASVAEAHAKRSDTHVRLETPDAPVPEMSEAVRICVYRFVQEGLANALRHGGGLGQTVRLTLDDRDLHLSVLDRGRGIEGAGPDARHTPAGSGGGLGLAGLRDRVESLGGCFAARHRDGGGTEICMDLPIRDHLT